MNGYQDGACTNKSMAAIFEAFVGMKEDIKSALLAGPAKSEAAAAPVRQHDCRSKKSAQEIFDVEHHDRDDLMLLVRSLLRHLEQC